MNAKVVLYNGTALNQTDITLYNCEWNGTPDEIRVLTAAFNSIEVVSNETGEVLFQYFVAPCMFSQLLEIPNALAAFLAEDEDEDEYECEGYGADEDLCDDEDCPLLVIDPDEFHKVVQAIMGDKDEE